MTQASNNSIKITLNLVTNMIVNSICHPKIINNENRPPI